jgi:WD40 repeat protein
MESEDHHQALIRGHSKPLCYSQNQESIVVGEASNELLLINKHDPSQYFRVPTGKVDKTISLKLTDKLLVRAGVEGTVTLWDSRDLQSSTSIHTFSRKCILMKVLDVSSVL